MKQRLSDWLVLMVLTFIWGTSYILMKKGLLGLTPYQITGLRMVVAMITLFPFMIRGIRFVKKKHLLPLVFVGLGGTFAPTILYTTCITKIDSSITGVINSLTPLFTMIFAVMFFSLKTNRTQLLGIIIGSFGYVGTGTDQI